MSGKNIEHYVIGLMSGTSLDGIDASLVNILDRDGAINVQPIHFSTLPFPDDVKEHILQLCTPDTAQIENISMMNMLLGEYFAEAVEKVIQDSGVSRNDICLISSHGQTIFHQPDSHEINGRDITSTLQIGDISVIAERTGIMTVGDFRTRDMAVGGQGAPLVPYVDYLLFQKPDIGRALVNIGGIANITILPKNGSKSDVIAYDTGPGNMIIDAFTTWKTNGKASYDKDGLLAAAGEVQEKWLNQLLQHAYFKQSAPKTTGRELFGLHFAEKLWNDADRMHISELDRISTITELTARTITMEIKKYIVSHGLNEILISGGGHDNKELMNRIHMNLPVQLQVKGSESCGISADEKEAVAFAILGYQCYRQRPNNLSSATGAARDVVMGKIAW